MHVRRCDHAAEFLEATLEYRSGEPLRTNVLGSVATTVASGEVPAAAEEFWWLVCDDGDRVVGAAMRNAPYPLSLGPMDAACAAALAASVAAVDGDLPSVAGFASTVASFLAAFAVAGPAARTALPSQRQVLYAAPSVAVPDVAGELSVATEDELALAQRWYHDFSEEVDGVRPTPSEVDRATLLATLRSGRLRWWRDGGDVVSMAANAAPVTTLRGTVTRVGPVYTPPAQRRRGYAAVLTGRLTQTLLDGGSAAMLFADAANATSNGVYRRLGYVAVDELVRTPLTAAG